MFWLLERSEKQPQVSPELPAAARAQREAAAGSSGETAARAAAGTSGET